MANITIRNLDEDLMRRLSRLAAEQGLSTEQVAKNILRVALSCETPQAVNLGTAIHMLFKGECVKLEIPLREPVREPPRFN